MNALNICCRCSSQFPTEVKVCPKCGSKDYIKSFLFRKGSEDIAVENDQNNMARLDSGGDHLDLGPGDVLAGKGAPLKKSGLQMVLDIQCKEVAVLKELLNELKGRLESLTRGADEDPKKEPEDRPMPLSNITKRIDESTAGVKVCQSITSDLLKHLEI